MLPHHYSLSLPHHRDLARDVALPNHRELDDHLALPDEGVRDVAPPKVARMRQFVIDAPCSEFGSSRNL